MTKDTAKVTAISKTAEMIADEIPVPVRLSGRMQRHQSRRESRKQKCKRRKNEDIHKHTAYRKYGSEMEERALRPDLCRLSTCPSRTTQLQQEPRNLATSRQTVLAAQPEVVLTLEVIRTSRTVTTLQAKKRHKAHLR
eukprot:s3699_g3.t1